MHESSPYRDDTVGLPDDILDEIRPIKNPEILVDELAGGDILTVTSRTRDDTMDIFQVEKVDGKGQVFLVPLHPGSPQQQSVYPESFIRLLLKDGVAHIYKNLHVKAVADHFVPGKTIPASQK